MSTTEEVEKGDMTDEGVFVQKTTAPNPSFEKVRTLKPTHPKAATLGWYSRESGGRLDHGLWSRQMRRQPSRLPNLSPKRPSRRPTTQPILSRTTKTTGKLRSPNARIVERRFWPRQETQLTALASPSWAGSAAPTCRMRLPHAARPLTYQKSRLLRIKGRAERTP